MQINSTVSFTGKKPPKEPKIKNRGLVAAGYMSSIMTGAATTAAAVLNNSEKKIELDSYDVVQIKKGIQDGLKNSGLYDKGVRVYRMKEINQQTFLKRVFSEVQNLFNAETNGDIETTIKSAADNVFSYGKKDKKALNAIKDVLDTFLNKNSKINTRINEVFQDNQDTVSAIKDGLVDIAAKTAGLKYKLGMAVNYFPSTNKIIAPDKSLQASIFHEMGHALNNNGGSLMKMLQRIKPVAMVLPGIILGAALLNKRKVNDEQLPTDSKFQRLKDGIKRNAGKLTALAFAPMLVEEGAASLRGGKIAKDLFKLGKLSTVIEDGKLSKELLNKVRLANITKFAGYALLAAGTVAATKLAIKIKDKLQARYEAKQEEKYQAKLEKYNQKMAVKEAKKVKKA